jgi:hypothetical protein
VANFLKYPLSYCFYAKRSFFPHEVAFDSIMQTPDTDDHHSDRATQTQPSSAEKATDTAAADAKEGNKAAEASNTKDAKVLERHEEIGAPTAAAVMSEKKGNPLQRKDASEAEKMEQLGQ